jgi:hypothetical protein
VTEKSLAVVWMKLELSVMGLCAGDFVCRVTDRVRGRETCVA